MRFEAVAEGRRMGRAGLVGSGAERSEESTGLSRPRPPPQHVSQRCGKIEVPGRAKARVPGKPEGLVLLHPLGRHICASENSGPSVGVPFVGR